MYCETHQMQRFEILEEGDEGKSRGEQEKKGKKDKAGKRERRSFNCEKSITMHPCIIDFNIKTRSRRGTLNLPSDLYLEEDLGVLTLIFRTSSEG